MKAVREASDPLGAGIDQSRWISGETTTPTPSANVSSFAIGRFDRGPVFGAPMTFVDGRFGKIQKFIRRLAPIAAVALSRCGGRDRDARHELSSIRFIATPAMV